MKLQSISLIAAICLVATAAASPIPKEEKRVAKPHNDKRAPKHDKRNALGKRATAATAKKATSEMPLHTAKNVLPNINKFGVVLNLIVIALKPKTVNNFLKCPFSLFRTIVSII
ncbi:hypothetical protein F8M41_007894 [Gigaspora margarita]|uniref:Uncharacterized protein n=1 Tax=Gigaspora margarita TaxID=4874 RepID=A0A8H4ER70_GIGMA|nr:hypothetical protein F8M41_007894 [Gigaspora margarita]